MSDILQVVKNRDPKEKEFHQAVSEVMESVKPVLDQNPIYRQAKIPQRLVEPERQIIFRVSWEDDRGQKGGLGFVKQGLVHPSLQDVQLCLIHDPAQSEQETIVVVRWVVETILVGEHRSKDCA